MAGSDYLHAIKKQQWVLLLAVVVFGIAPAGLLTLLGDPRNRFLYVNDVTLSYPHTTSESVPSWVLGITAICVLFPIAGVEWYMLKEFPRPQRVWSILYIFVDYAISLCLGLTVMLYFKTLVGRYRPDFLSRCTVDSSNSLVINNAFQGAVSDLCSNWETDKDMILEGMVSYPSGHASTSFTEGMFLSLYFFWTFFARKLVGKKTGKRTYCIHELMGITRVFAVFAPLIIAFLISVSRVIDYVHNPSDINCGAAIGMLAASFGMLKVSLQYDFHLRTYYLDEDNNINDPEANRVCTHTSECSCDSFSKNS